MNVLGGNSKEIFELFTNKLVLVLVSVAKMKMMILTRHLLIRHAFREKCIFTDEDYIRVFVFDLIYFIK